MVQQKIILFAQEDSLLYFWCIGYNACFSETSGSHGGKYEDDSLLGYSAV
jgi:hypothetical protein